MFDDYTIYSFITGGESKCESYGSSEKGNCVLVECDDIIYSNRIVIPNIMNTTDKNYISSQSSIAME